MAPVMMVPIFARNAARARYSAGRAMSACSRAPMPNAAAPIAKGPTSGANVAAVPVVPQSAAEPSTERVPKNEPSGVRYLVMRRLASVLRSCAHCVNAGVFLLVRRGQRHLLAKSSNVLRLAGHGHCLRWWGRQEDDGQLWLLLLACVL